jgi:hypothetical protein
VAGEETRGGREIEREEAIGELVISFIVFLTILES